VIEIEEPMSIIYRTVSDPGRNHGVKVGGVQHVADWRMQGFTLEEVTDERGSASL
jgi:hypothetical protein